MFDWPAASVILGVLATITAGILQFSPGKMAAAPAQNGDTVKFREFSDFREEVREGFDEVKTEIRLLRERS